MQIREIMDLQKEFDLQHQGKIPFFEKISDENIHVLEHLLVCLIGEVGEVSNITKKIVRGDKELTLLTMRQDIAEELADVFIYLIKICNQLDVDLEKEFIRKLEINEKRFKHYEGK